MFRKQDFKKIDLLGSGNHPTFHSFIHVGKKNTKIYKAEHIPTGKIYAIKEVEAKTLDKLNEYKVRRLQLKTYLGRSSAAVQGTESPECPAVLRLLLL